RLLGAGVLVQRHLALPVIAHAHGLENGRVAEVAHCPHQRRGIGYFPVGGGVDADRAKKILLAQAVLRDRENFGLRQNRLQLPDPADRLGGDVFELAGCDVDSRREALQRFAVRVISHRRRAADLLRRAVRLVGKDVTAIAEPGGGERRHPTQLAAAQYADSRPRRRHHCPAGRSATACVWACRHPSSACAAAGCVRPRIAAAKSAALTAPAWPMAKVATGIPAGIWTIE